MEKNIPREKKESWRGEKRRRIFDEMSRKSLSLLYNSIKKNKKEEG